MSEATYLHSDLETQELPCVAIPAEGATLLLPNVCVAEIVQGRAVKQVAEAPVWLSGVTGWRGQTIPVVNFSGFAETTEHLPPAPGPAHTRCLVVMNRSRVAGAPAFYGLQATGLPRILQLTAGDIKNHSDELSAADAMHVVVGTELATIPDLGYVEQQLQRLDLDPVRAGE